MSSEQSYTPAYPRSTLFSAISIASDAANTGRRSGVGFKTGTSRRGPPSVAESIASQDAMSSDTKRLFKSMMGQSKLSSFQQRMLDNLVNSGSSLPAKPTPGLAPRPSSAASHASSATSLLSMGDVEAERKQMKKRAMKAGLTAPRSGVRSLATILESDAFKEEVYRPGVSKNFETEKKKLQKFMETDGGKIAVDDAEEAEDAAVDASSQIAHGRRRGLGKGHFARAAEGNGVSMEMAELDEFDMVFKEIEERKQWLDDMISLGRGDVYRQQIQNEIATRIKRLEQIDRERATAVQP